MNKPPVNNTFDIDTWYQQPIGNTIAKLERQQLTLLPKTLFGQTILQLGAPTHCDWLDIKNNYTYITAAPDKPNAELLYHVRSTYTELPFPANSFDAIILSHVLEFAINPKDIIAECWHALAPEGHLIILGFNPWSLNNLCCLFDKTKINLPTWTTFHSVNKIYQWLKNNYYEVVYNHSFIYLPLSTDEQQLTKWTVIEKLATWLLPNCGNLYLLVIKKKVIPLTPLRLRWHWRDLLSNKDQLTEPAAGNVHRE